MATVWPTSTPWRTLVTAILLNWNVLLFLKVSALETCNLPDDWRGSWFLKGVGSNLVINKTWISFAGECIDKSNYKFKFVEKREIGKCYRCLLMFESHKNVIQFRQSEHCEMNDLPLDELCLKIHSSADLHTMIRLDTNPVECPFEMDANYQFSYRTSHGICKDRVSTAEVCSLPYAMRLEFEACPDVRHSALIWSSGTRTIVGFNVSEESMWCYAVWPLGNKSKYLIAKMERESRKSLDTLEDQYRCLLVEEVRDKGHGSPVTGYRMSISGDASCSALTSVDFGEKTLNLTKSKEEVHKPNLPEWVNGRWDDLNETVRYEFGRDPKLSVSNVFKCWEHNPSLEESMSATGDGLKITSFYSQESSTDLSKNSVALYGYSKIDCRRKRPICVRLTRLTEGVAKLQTFQSIPQPGNSYNENFAAECISTRSNVPNSHMKTSILNKMGNDIERRCPSKKSYNLKNIMFPELAYTVAIGHDHSSVEAVKNDADAYLKCLKSWKDEEFEFMIVRKEKIGDGLPLHFSRLKESSVNCLVWKNYTSLDKNFKCIWFTTDCFVPHKKLDDLGSSCDYHVADDSGEAGDDSISGSSSLTLSRLHYLVINLISVLFLLIHRH